MFWIGILIFLLLRSPCKISKLVDASNKIEFVFHLQKVRSSSIYKQKLRSSFIYKKIEVVFHVQKKLGSSSILRFPAVVLTKYSYLDTLTGGWPVGRSAYYDIMAIIY